MLNRQESFSEAVRDARRLVAGTQIVGPVSAVVGTVAGFWHILWIAGVASLGFAILGVVVTVARSL